MKVTNGPPHDSVKGEKYFGCIAGGLRRVSDAARMGAALATYLVWPHNRDTWPGKFEAIPPVFARMAAAIAEFEPLRLLVGDARPWLPRAR